MRSDEEYELLQQELMEVRAQRDRLELELTKTRTVMRVEVENLLKVITVLKGFQQGDASNANSNTEEDHRKWTRETTGAMLAGIPKNEDILREAEIFEATVVKGLHNFKEGVEMVRRTKAVSLVAQRMLVADTEEELHEAVSRLIVALFGVQRCSFAIMVNDHEFVVMSCNVTNSDYTVQLQGNKRIPAQGTSIGRARETRQIQNTPNAAKSPLKDHQMIASMGLSSCMNAPILLNNKTQFFGTLNVAHHQENAFTAFDELFLQDIARMFGENLYLKRLQAAEREGQKISQQLLYSVVPEPVVKKIQHHWEEDTSSAAKSSLPVADGNIPNDNEMEEEEEEEEDHDEENPTTNKSNNKRRRGRRPKKGKRMSVIARLNLQDDAYNALEGLDDLDASMAGSSSDGTNVSRALYAEDVLDVCIIFADIVGFSKIAMKISTRDVMDMLQEVFSRFDSLCDKHKVLKLETIGDAFVGATGLLEEENDDNPLLSERTAPQRALAFARDMINVANTVRIPVPANQLDGLSATVSLRVGVHCGDVTCGVLGQNCPKFSVFGHPVNMAARLEQTCLPDQVHASEDFFHQVKNDKEGTGAWQGPRTVTVKNMGDVQSWLYNPL